MKWSVLLAALCLCAGTVTPARAAVIRYAYAGRLNTALGNLPAGTPFSGELFYEQNQVDAIPGTSSGDYNYTNMALVIGGDAHVTGAGQISIFNNPDVITVTSPLLVGSIGEMTIHRVGLTLANANGTLYNGVALPGANLTLAPFGPPGAAYLELRTAQGGIFGALTTLVAIPEPSGAVLSLSAAGFTLLSRRRRSTMRRAVGLR